jgi:hypothetical protein
MRNSRWLLALMLGAAFLTGGCATPALWGVKDCKPSANGSLSISFAPEKHDFLVKYDEVRGLNTKISEKKSYWLLAYSDNPPKNHRPAFVQEADLPELAVIPILKWKDPVPETGYCAMYIPLQGTFDLYHNGVDLGRFTLPNYSTERQPANFARVVLTPPAAVADTALAACGIGLLIIGHSNGF